MTRAGLPVGLLTGTALLALGAAPAAAINIDNGVAGDGRIVVDSLAGGETRTFNLDPTGATGLTEIVFDYFHYIDVGADGGGVRLGSLATSGPTLTGAAEVSSSGSFLGQNGTIDWTAVSSIAPGSTVYQTTLSFSSNDPFGVVRVIQYLDEDVLGVSDDRLIVLGTPGGADFNLLTIDDDNDVGISHSASYLTAQGMDYIGWAADEFSDLRSAITGAGAAYSIAGVVDTGSLPDLGIGGDARFPGAQAYGPEDITSAIAFDFDPDATFASVIFALGGAPSGTPPPPPDDDNGNQVPEPASMLMFAAGLLGFAVSRRRRRA